MELEQALKYVSTLSAKGGRIVPVDENGRDARIEKYVQFIFQRNMDMLTQGNDWRT